MAGSSDYRAGWANRFGGGKGHRMRKVTLRLVDAIPDRISGSISVTRMSGTTTEDVCSGGALDKLAAGRVRTVTYTCGSSAIVIGGTVASGVAADQGDLVTFTFGGRNGTLTLTSRVG